MSNTRFAISSIICMALLGALGGAQLAQAPPTVGPNGRLMTVCGSVGGVSIDPKTGKILKTVPQGADAERRGNGMRSIATF
jgi:hypothetical protein